MKRLLPVLFIALFLPQVAFAAWWNPFSWFDNKYPKAQETTRIEEVEAIPASATFYTEPDNTRLRSCDSFECDIVGYYPQNTQVVRDATLETLPEWVQLYFDDKPIGYIHKSTLSDKPVEKSKPKIDSADSTRPATTNSSVTSEESAQIPSGWTPLTNFCNGEYWASCSDDDKFVCSAEGKASCVASNLSHCNGDYYQPCSNGQTFVCPASGAGYCLLPTQQTSNQSIYSDTTPCNGKNWNRCPTGQDFVCPATGDAYCQYPYQQPAPPPTYQQVQRQETPARDIAKENEIASLKAQLAELQEQAKALQAKKTQGLADIAGQPIAYSFISGQQASLERQINLDLQANALKQSEIITKIATLEGITLPPPIIPSYTSNIPSSIQCYWDGPFWSCSGREGSGTNIKCYVDGPFWRCDSN